ncbi:MAG: cation:proton antiporter [Lewinellaceae bacterium]|nr:cation:proton antiporter [Lewinellaceae bacterium]
MQLLAELTLIFSIAAFILYISARLKAPSIIGLIFSGLIVGPYGLGLIQSDADIQVLAEIGILLLLFTIGVEFSVEKLSKTCAGSFWAEALSFFFDCRDRIPGRFLVGITLPSIHLYWLPFAVSSTAIVLHIYRDKYQLDTPAGRSGLPSSFFRTLSLFP